MPEDRALHLVLDKRKRDEDAAFEDWVFCRNQVANFELQIKQVEEFRFNYIGEMENEGRSGLTGTKLLAYQAFIEKLDNIALKQRQELERLKMLTEQKRQFYLKRQVDRKVIEALLEKHRIRRQKEELKREQKLLDEYVVANYTRRRQVQDEINLEAEAL
ncbi:MAG: flagellar export protein FliJ [Candidatus Anaerobiospirillum pullicola]|uniref:Flagellar FliJ protein n=1 Tax=Candidatus Anaerobiospirillum pullicola TaxID=2838451 RepID=A0A948WYF2_9GAMM|nr:flagellar export protein FliJ [Candidatus Anaerobiospirillum pullicola]